MTLRLLLWTGTTFAFALGILVLVITIRRVIAKSRLRATKGVVKSFHAIGRASGAAVDARHHHPCRFRRERTLCLWQNRLFQHQLVRVERRPDAPPEYHYEPGQKVTVWYDPENPRRCGLIVDRPPWLMLPIPFVIGALFLCVALWFPID